MLWYKAWLETRWRFLIGLLILMFSSWAVVLGYPQVLRLLPLVPTENVSSELGRQIKEAAELARTFGGYVWSQWFRQNLPQTWTVFAVLLGTGGLLAQGAGGGALFTLSLPITRSRLLTVRAATALAELFALALVPSLLLSVLAPTIGQSYSIVDALIHAACLFVGGAVFFSLAFLLSTVFPDVWRPLLIALCAAFLLGIAGQFARDLTYVDVFRVMSAETYFRSGAVPWAGLVASAVLSVVMLLASVRTIARQDF
jgi:ABC-2 type transport system permease protein